MAAGLTRLRTAVIRALDRRGGRQLLAALASTRLTLAVRRPTAVRWRDGAWVYEWRGGTIRHPVVGSALHPEEARRILFREHVPRAGEVVFDVGAGVGDTTLLFSRLVGPKGRVVAVEAHPVTFGWLLDLCRVNRLENVTPLQLAASDHDGEERLTDEDLALNTTVRGRQDDDTGTMVVARRLDDVALDLGVERIDFLKMNIEGAERLALGGMQTMIRNTHHVCISCHDFLADRGGRPEMRTKAFVSEFLTAHGFRLRTEPHASGWAGSYVYGTNTNWRP